MAKQWKISNRLLDEGDNFILLFPTESAKIGKHGVTIGRGFFFKVLSWDRFILEYDHLTAIDAGSGVDYNYLGESGLGSGDDVLRIKDDEWWLYHFGFSMSADPIRVYRRMAGRLALGGFEYHEADEPDPTNGDDYGYVLGAEVDDTYDPPAYTETVCWYTGETDKPLWEWGFYNEHPTKQLTGKLILVGRQYKVIPITKPDIQRDMIAGRIPRTIISVGGLRVTREEAFIPDDWKNFNEHTVAFTELTGVEVD